MFKATNRKRSIVWIWSVVCLFDCWCLKEREREGGGETERAGGREASIIHVLKSNPGFRSTPANWREHKHFNKSTRGAQDGKERQWRRSTSNYWRWRVWFCCYCLFFAVPSACKSECPVWDKTNTLWNTGGAVVERSWWEKNTRQKDLPWRRYLRTFKEVIRPASLYTCNCPCSFSMYTYIHINTKPCC